MLQKAILKISFIFIIIMDVYLQYVCLSMGAFVWWHACGEQRVTFSNQCSLTALESRYEKAIKFSCQALSPTELSVFEKSYKRENDIDKIAESDF